MTSQDRTTACPALAPSLSAFLDGELPALKRRGIRRHVRGCAGCAHELELVSAARQAVRGLRASHVATALPAAPLAANARVPARPYRARWTIATVGLAATVAAFFWFVMLWMNHGNSGSGLVALGVKTHEAVASAASPVTLATGDVAEAGRWASTAAGRKLDAPVLDGAGFHLLGVRLEAEAAPGAVTFVYTGDGGLLTCLVVPGRRNLPGAGDAIDHVHVASLDYTAVALWLENQSTYVLAGDLSRQSLLTAAHAAVQQDDSDGD